MTLTQLRRLAGMLVERQRLAQAYNEWLRPLETEGFLQLPLDALGRIWYRYAVRLCSHKAEDLVARMAEHGVRAEQPVWDLRRTPVWHNDCPATTEAFDRVLSLPLYPGLSEFDQHRVCVSLDKGLRA